MNNKQILQLIIQASRHLISIIVGAVVGILFTLYHQGSLLDIALWSYIGSVVIMLMLLRVWHDEPWAHGVFTSFVSASLSAQLLYFTVTYILINHYLTVPVNQVSDFVLDNASFNAFTGFDVLNAIFGHLMLLVAYGYLDEKFYGRKAVQRSLTFEKATGDELPKHLLLDADPDMETVKTYIYDGINYVAKRKGQIVALCCIKALDESANVMEIHNVAVSESFKGKGLGTWLLKRVIQDQESAGTAKIELSTGAFGYQLGFYQRVGFRVIKVFKNYFTDNYPEPIFENGIQHQDMLRLSIDLQ